MNVITRNGDFNRDGHEDVIARESAPTPCGSTAAPGLVSHRA